MALEYKLSFTAQEIDEKLSKIGEPIDLSEYATKEDLNEYQIKGNYITEHQPIKTINGQSLIGVGNISITGGGDSGSTGNVGNTGSIVNADFKADVYMIPCYGQSLSTNTSAGASTFNYIEPLSYDVNLNNTNIQDMCAGTAESFRIMADYYGISLPANFKIIGCTGGAGGRSVKQLSKGSTFYNNVINSVKTAKASCDAAGLTMIVPCFTWTQGEEDMRAGGSPSSYGYGDYNPHTYKDRLKQLIEDFNTDIKAITGQKEDILCVSYQLTSHTSYSRYPRIAFQLQELAEEYDKMIVAKVMYDLEYVQEGTSEVHAYARSYRNIGNLYGVAAFNACVLNKRKRWCYPMDYNIRGNKVIIRFDTPFTPLVLDTQLINQLPDGNYGFNVYNVDEQNGAAGSIVEAETRVTNVQLRGDDTVEITLSRNPVEGETLTYGVNGDYWVNVAGTKAITTGGQGPNGYSKSGWQYGARGCLRDSQPFKNNNNGAVFHDLYNWSVLFEIPFTAENLGGGYVGGSGDGSGGGTGDGGSYDGECPAESFIFTVNTDPSDAVVLLNGIETKSLIVHNGATVEWTVMKEGYETLTGGQLVDNNITIDVTINPLEKYTVTINTVPEDALVIIEDDEISSRELYEGTVVDWVVSKEGYITKIGAFTLTEDVNMTVELINISDIDPDAYNYVSTINVTDDEQIYRVNNLVASLKEENLWDKIEALYPCVGDTFEQMSYNLRDTSTYKLSCDGDTTVVANTSVYSNSAITSDTPTRLGSDLHLMGHSLTKYSEVKDNLLCPGPSNSIGYDSRGGVLTLINGGILTRTTNADIWRCDSSATVDGTGLVISSLTSGIVYNGVDTGAIKTGSPSVTLWAEDGFMHNCYGTVQNPFIMSLSGFGHTMTTEEMQKYSEILNEFKNIYTPFEYVTFTVVSQQSDSIVTINNSERTSLRVPKGSTVNWSVSKDGHATEFGTSVVDSDETINVSLVLIDADTQAYLDATNITDQETVAKVNTLVKSLKEENLWDKIEALYPCTGSTFEQMSYNLRNPSTYRLTCDTTPTIVENTSMYCVDAQIKSDTPTRLGSDFHLMGYSLNKYDEVENSLLCPTPSNAGGLSTDKGGILALISSSGTVLRTTTSDTWRTSTIPSNNGSGLLVTSLTSGIVYNGENMNATKNGTPSVTKWDTDGFHYNCYNSSGSGAVGTVRGAFEVGLSGFGYGMTIAEMQKYSEILNEFKGIY